MKRKSCGKYLQKEKCCGIITETEDKKNLKYHLDKIVKALKDKNVCLDFIEGGAIFMAAEKEPEKKKMIKLIPFNKPFAMDIDRAKAEQRKKAEEGASYDETAKMVEHYLEYGIPIIPENKPFVFAQPHGNEEYYDGEYIPLLPHNKPVMMDIAKADAEYGMKAKEENPLEYISKNKSTETTNEKKTEADQDTQSKKNQVTQTNSPESPRIEYTRNYNVGNYFFKDDELIYINGKSKIPLGNVWITILKELIYQNEYINEHNEVIDIKTERQWLVDIECLGNHFEEQCKVTELMDYSKILRFTADRAYLETSATAKSAFRKYVNLLIAKGNFKKEIRYKSTGWKKIEGRWLYVTDIGVIGMPTLPCKADTSQKFVYDSSLVDTFKTFNDFFHMRMLSKKKMKNTVFLMHYSCLAVMTTLFQEIGHGINFVVALIGTTNSQKTSTATIFTRMYNRSETATADIRFDSTKAAILEKTSTYGDSILMVDDILPYEDSTLAKQQNDSVREIIRAYGDRTAKMRSEVFAQINNVDRYSPIRGCCLITGEVLNLDEESTATRTIKLYFERDDIDLSRLSFYQNNLSNLPTFMYGYIRYITENMEKIFEAIEKTFRTIRGAFYPENMPRRFVDTIAIMLSEVRIFYLYAVDKGFLEEKEALHYKIDDVKYIKDIIIGNYYEMQVQSPATRILMSLKWAIDKEKISCYSLHGKYIKGISPEEIVDIVITTDDWICISPNKLLEIYRLYCKEINQSVSYKSGRELADPLKKDNVILLKEEGGSIRSSHKLWSKSSKRFYYICMRKFSELCGKSEDF